MTDISVAEYYERIVPEQFATALASASGDVAGQPELTATYEITGEGGGVYGLRIANGQLEVVPGGIEGGDMRTVVGLADWQSSASADEADPVIDYYTRGKVQAIKSLKGVMRLDLTRSDGSPYESALIFGGVEEPEVIIRMTTSDYADMVRGRLNGQMAFMTGKLKFEGSLPLLMQLGALNS